MISLLSLGLTSALLITMIIIKIDNFLEDEGEEQWEI